MPRAQAMPANGVGTRVHQSEDGANAQQYEGSNLAE